MGFLQASAFDKAASIIKLLANYILLLHELHACYTYNTLKITKFQNIPMSAAHNPSIPSTMRIPHGSFQLHFNTDGGFICCRTVFFLWCFLSFLHNNFIWNQGNEDVLVTEIFSLFCSKLHMTVK